MYGRVRPDARRDRLVGRLGILSRGTPIAAAFAVVGIGAVAAISYPGKSSAGDATTGGGTGQDAAATAVPTDGSAATSNDTTGQNGVSTPQGATPTLVAPTIAPVPVGNHRGHVSSGGS
jgi:hypothetical protein